MEEMKRLTAPIRFGIFEVQAAELRRQGFNVKLQEQPFQILMLLERPGLRAAAGALAAVLVLSLGLNTGGMRDRFLAWRAQPRIESLAVLPLQNLSSTPRRTISRMG